MSAPTVRAAARAFTLIDLLITVAIIGILAALVVPQFSNASEQALVANLEAQLKTIRNQVALYDMAHPDSRFDPLVPGGAQAWDQLVGNDYLQAAPRNPLQLDSTAVAAFPAVGTGWVWADLGGGTNIYAVSEAAGFFDGDGDGTPD